MSVRPSPHPGPPESRTLRGAASKCSKPSKYLGPIPQRTERPEEGQLRAPRVARCPDALVLAGVLGAFLYALDARVLDEELGAVLKSAGLPTRSCSPVLVLAGICTPSTHSCFTGSWVQSRAQET